jgi:MOSC domain-containing protein YiiM
MFTGRLVGIYTTAEAGKPLVASTEINAIAGAGLDGDRYAAKRGTYSDREGPHRQVTFIEREVIAAVTDDSGVELGEHETRRNLVTEGVPLHHLIGQTFRVGDVVFRGIKSCPPCAFLEELTRPGVRTALVNRGGLRAEILQGGMLRIGDEITAVPG